ncbi:adenine nucleotide alpha hydrolase [Benzoatithermus flavus]|uniref:Adenine nucleotide alpha hydrolase n=1 Tax=Benzoatithermus flavus TaxID=3108223 RepID=A0ABU8XZQ4_9PROT
MSASALDRLVAVLDRHGSLALAVSGGQDSMTLAHVAHRFAATKPTLFHAVSPAVPASARERLERHAAAHAWNLVLLDAGELGDPRYVANPLNRCYFCKSNLYERIRAATDAVIASGTNTDDLGDFRPGLEAAAERGVVHPYVEAGIGKAGITGLARALGLDDLAALPAQPCLASRIETGLAVTEEDLRFIGAIEAELAGLLGPSAVLRCRVTHDGAVIELGSSLLDRSPEVAARAAAACAVAGRRFLGVRPYRRGSAFLRG